MHVWKFGCRFTHDVSLGAGTWLQLVGPAWPQVVLHDGGCKLDPQSFVVRFGVAASAARFQHFTIDDNPWYAWTAVAAVAVSSLFRDRVGSLWGGLLALLKVPTSESLSFGLVVNFQLSLLEAKRPLLVIRLWLSSLR